MPPAEAPIPMIGNLAAFVGTGKTPAGARSREVVVGKGIRARVGAAAFRRVPPSLNSTPARCSQRRTTGAKSPSRAPASPGLGAAAGDRFEVRPVLEWDRTTRLQ